MGRGLRADVALFVKLCDELTAEEFAVLLQRLLVIVCSFDARGLHHGKLGHHRVFVSLSLLAELQEVWHVDIFIRPGQSAQDNLLVIAAYKYFLL